jgi:hypothetical protein
MLTTSHRRSGESAKESEDWGDTTALYARKNGALIGLLYSYPAQVVGVSNLMSAVIMHSAFTAADGIDLCFGPVQVTTSLHGPDGATRAAFLKEIDEQRKQGHAFESYAHRLTLVWQRGQQPFTAMPKTPPVPSEMQDVLALGSSGTTVSERTWRTSGQGGMSPLHTEQYSWISGSDAGTSLRFDQPVRLPPDYQLATFLDNAPEHNPAYMKDAFFFMWEDCFGIQRAPSAAVVPLDRPYQPLGMATPSATYRP